MHIVSIARPVAADLERLPLDVILLRLSELDPETAKAIRTLAVQALRDAMKE